MKRNCLFISFYTPKKCMEEYYEQTLDFGLLKQNYDI